MPPKKLNYAHWVVLGGHLSLEVQGHHLWPEGITPELGYHDDSDVVIWARPVPGPGDPIELRFRVMAKSADGGFWLSVELFAEVDSFEVLRYQWVIELDQAGELGAQAFRVAPSGDCLLPGDTLMRVSDPAGFFNGLPESAPDVTRDIVESAASILGFPREA